MVTHSERGWAPSLVVLGWPFSPPYFSRQHDKPGAYESTLSERLRGCETLDSPNTENHYYISRCRRIPLMEEKTRNGILGTLTALGESFSLGERVLGPGGVGLLKVDFSGDNSCHADFSERSGPTRAALSIVRSLSAARHLTSRKGELECFNYQTTASLARPH